MSKLIILTVLLPLCLIFFTLLGACIAIKAAGDIMKKGEIL